VCGFDGICGNGCDRKDLDCPISGFLGDSCDDREDCESLVCLESPEDARVKYCSTPCDPNNPDDFWSCRPPLSNCVSAGDGTYYCRHSGITPGVQGYECSDHDECRSSICYPPSDGICAEQCGDGLPACAEGYSCENIGDGVDACIVPENGGCCRTSAGPSKRSTAGTFLLIGLIALLLAPRRRRR
jgi:MYXO-CTERM domain-containing protein